MYELIISILEELQTLMCHLLQALILKYVWLLEGISLSFWNAVICILREQTIADIYIHASFVQYTFILFLPLFSLSRI